MLKRFAVVFLALTACVAARAEPRRIVSLNPCLDTVLVNVADRDQIAALSHYAREPDGSTISDIAKTLPYTSDNAEEIITLNPDLILSAGHSSLATRMALERVGFKTEMFQVPNTIHDSITQIRRIAALTGHPDRGEALIARIKAALDAVRLKPGQKTYSALIFQPSGLAAGSGSLVDEVMRLAGFRNAAARYGIKQWGLVGLEEILDHPPQILLADGATRSKPRWADRILSHPALAAVQPAMRRAEFPQTLLFCGGPVLIKTAEALAHARQVMEAQP